MKTLAHSVVVVVAARNNGDNDPYFWQRSTPMNAVLVKLSVKYPVADKISILDAEK